MNVYRKGSGRNTSYTFKKIDDEENERLLSQARQIVKLHEGAAWGLDQVIADTPVGRALHRAFPLRSHNKKSLRGKIFVQVLACSLAIMVRNHIAAYNALHPASESKVQSNLRWRS
ncbi:MAG: hypothetical protein K6F05_07405 [Succinivibrio sp.]|nr:hypothetical protein [Succinivibrio sp.]